MLPQNNRLKNKKDFENVFKNGKGFKEDFLYLKIVKNDFKNSRFGFIVSKKVSNKAVVRNKIRRRLKEILRMKIKHVKPGLDCVIIVRPGLEIMDFWDLERKIDNLLKKAKITD